MFGARVEPKLISKPFMEIFLDYASLLVHLVINSIFRSQIIKGKLDFIN